MIADDAWNNRNARAFADLFFQDGESIGFDGSQSIGKDEIFSHINPVFEHHATANTAFPEYTCPVPWTT